MSISPRDQEYPTRLKLASMCEFHWFIAHADDLLLTYDQAISFDHAIPFHLGPHFVMTPHSRHYIVTITSALHENPPPPPSVQHCSSVVGLCSGWTQLHGITYKVPVQHLLHNAVEPIFFVLALSTFDGDEFIPSPETRCN